MFVQNLIRISIITYKSEVVEKRLEKSDLQANNMKSCIYINLAEHEHR